MSYEHSLVFPFYYYYIPTNGNDKNKTFFRKDKNIALLLYL